MALGLAGCGFAPLYATKSSGTNTVNDDLRTVRIVPIKDRIGQQLRNALLARITPNGEPADYRYVLAVTLGETSSDLGYRRDSFATLGNLVVSAQVSLTLGDILVMTTNTSTTVSFDYLGPRYASVAMERDAEERAITQLADDIRSRVAVAIARFKANPTDPRYRHRSGGVEPIAKPVERP
jgi:LPS-assembly lipoprotein